MNRWASLIGNLVATFFIWLSVALVQTTTGSEGMTSFIAMLAFGITAILWLIWAVNLGRMNAQPASEKSKRSAAGDARLSLLIELMDDNERQVVRQRLLGDLNADGEALSLAELLARQENTARR